MKLAKKWAQKDKFLELSIFCVQAEQDQQLQRMEAIRDRWKRQLDELISQISAGFSQFFATMGFAGEVMSESKNSACFENFFSLVL